MVNKTGSITDALDLKNHQIRMKAALVVGVLVIVSWFGFFDTLAEAYINGALLQSGAAFAIAKGLNSIVSVIQTSTFDVGIGAGFSITVGEALDPINDLIEDYSDLMKTAIGSLIIQKLLVEIVSDELFKVLLTLSGGAFLASFVVKKGQYVNPMFKMFIFFVFVRFLMIAVLVLNSFVDSVFIADKVQKDIDLLQNLTNEIEQENVKSTIHPSGLSEQQIHSLEGQRNNTLNQIRSNEVQLGIHMTELKKLTTELNRLETQLDQFESQIGFKKYNPLASQAPEVISLTEKVALQERMINALDQEINTLNQAVKAQKNQTKRIQNTLNGLPNSFMESVSGKMTALSEGVSDFGNKYDIDQIENKLKASLDNMLNIMAIFVFKTLILPILFLVLLVKGTNRIWGVDVKTLLKQELLQKTEKA